MAQIFTLSAYETSARNFFTALNSHGADLVLDIRLKNSSQLCGFTKRSDLEYFVPHLSHAAYISEGRFAPSPQLLNDYLSHRINWEAYRSGYRLQMEANHAVRLFKDTYGAYTCVCLLGTATKARRSHSEVLLELLAD